MFYFLLFFFLYAFGDKRYKCRWCPLFRYPKVRCGLCHECEILTLKCSHTPYLIRGIPKSNDIKGFCAAGLIPYVIVDGEVFLSLLDESRKGVVQRCFYGGKRDRITEGPKVTAVREFVEECKIPSLVNRVCETPFDTASPFYTAQDWDGTVKPYLYGSIDRRVKPIYFDAIGKYVLYTCYVDPGLLPEEYPDNFRDSLVPLRHIIVDIEADEPDEEVCHPFITEMFRSLHKLQPLQEVFSVPEVIA